ncbi:hypothetical protein H8356DRAFT_1076498 [Neocallimastix lanati (nom. inval.)]|nr:hypothetical protein H8356DRAFT_1076498 [Neocallimastix sp. JGI-2020a]
MKYIYLTVTKSENTEENQMIDEDDKEIYNKDKYPVIEAINNLTSFIANKENHKNNKGKDPEKDNDDNNKDISEIDNIEPDKIDKKNNDITKEEKNDKNLKKK